MTASQISDVLKTESSYYMNSIIIGKPLNKIGFKRINGAEKRVKGYMIKLIEE